MKRLDNNTPEINGVVNGINKAADIITSTMGGTGRNVLISAKNTSNQDDLMFTKDGVSVARLIKFKNTEEDIGAQLLINAANQTVKECGDGTTLTSLLTKEFVNKLFELDVPVNDKLDETRQLILDTIEYLKVSSTKVETLDDIYRVAFTSCKSDKLASLIREIYRKTGFKAQISVEESKNFNHTYYEISEGLNFETGLIHPNFSNQDSGNCSFEKPTILIDENTAVLDDYIDFINECHRSETPLVIMAKGFSDELIQYCLANKKANKLQICLTKLPGWGDGIAENIKDLKAFLTNFKANKITITPYQFTVYNRPDKQKIRNRIKVLNAKLDNATEDWEKLDFERRIANLNQVAAIIYVGGITEKNAQEEFDRIEDAVGACKSALQLGYVKGAGTALYEYAQRNQDNLPRWFYEILKAPAYKILSNANLQLEPTFEPFNVRTRKIDNLLIDPTSVLVSALQNSFALAELLINTSYTLYE